MTRGQLVCILPNKKIYSSIEYNGDMYLDGAGIKAVDALKAQEITTPEIFKEVVTKFNKENHDYKEDWANDIHEHPEEDFDMTAEGFDYYKSWFSDYLYIKNNSDKSVYISTLNGGEMEIQPGYVVSLNFGNYEAPDCMNM